MLKRLMALILAVSVLLSLAACSVQKQEEELVPYGDTVVATVFGHEITKQQLYVAIAAYVSNYDMTMQDIMAETELRDKLISDYVMDAIMDYALAETAGNYGYDFNAEEQKAFEDGFNEFIISLDDLNKKDALEEGMTEAQFEEKKQELREKYYNVMGYVSEDAYKEYQKAVYISNAVEKLISSGITVDADAVEAYYNNLLNAGETVMPVTYTFTLSNPSIDLYAEDGYRYVKCLLLEFPAASVLQNVEYYSAGEDAKLQASVDRDVVYMQDTIDEIRGKLASGTDFDDLVVEYGQDTGMTIEPYKSRGYIAVVNDPDMIPSYREACEKLTDTDMVVECTTYKGYWFIQASEIVDEGPIPFEEVKPAMMSELVAMKQNLAYSEETAKLLDELQKTGDIEYDISRFYTE